VLSLLVDTLPPQEELLVLTTVVVHVTDNLAKDVKELNFGYRNDRTYNMCHWGLLPCTAVNVLVSTMSSQSRKIDQLKQAIFLTPANVAGGDSFPNPIPTQYIDAMELLKRHICLLDVIVGSHCHHRMIIIITHGLVVT